MRRTRSSDLDWRRFQQRRRSSNRANLRTPHECRASWVWRPGRPERLEQPMIEEPSTEPSCGKPPDTPWWPFQGCNCLRADGFVAVWLRILLLRDGYEMGVWPPTALTLESGVTPLLFPSLARTCCSRYSRQRSYCMEQARAKGD